MNQPATFEQLAAQYKAATTRSEENAILLQMQDHPQHPSNRPSLRHGNPAYYKPTAGPLYTDAVVLACVNHQKGERAQQWMRKNEQQYAEYGLPSSLK